MFLPARIQPSLRLPTGWRWAPARTDQDELHARPGPTVPHRAGPSGPQLVLAWGPLEDPEDWEATSLSTLDAALTGFELEDEDAFDLFGEPVLYRRYAHLIGSTDVLCDQWAWLRGEATLALTVTGSVAREDYWQWCDDFEAAAESLDVVTAVGSLRSDRD